MNYYKKYLKYKKKYLKNKDKGCSIPNLKKYKIKYKKYKQKYLDNPTNYQNGGAQQLDQYSENPVFQEHREFLNKIDGKIKTDFEEICKCIYSINETSNNCVLQSTTLESQPLVTILDCYIKITDKINNLLSITSTKVQFIHTDIKDYIDSIKEPSSFSSRDSQPDITPSLIFCDKILTDAFTLIQQLMEKLNKLILSISIEYYVKNLLFILLKYRGVSLEILDKS